MIENIEQINEAQRIADELCAECQDQLATDWFRQQSPERQSQIVEEGKRRALQSGSDLVLAIETRDIKRLKARLHKGNRVSCNAFTRITGQTIGRTEESVRDAIKRYVGDEVWDRFHADAEATREKAESERLKVESKLGERVRWHGLNTDGEHVGGLMMTGTRRELIEHLIVNGFEAHDAKRGFRKTIQMVHPKSGRCVTLETKVECEYARKRLAESKVVA